MGDFFDDLRYSLRMLIANPAFTITAIAALALGIGANSAIFTVVNTVLLKPLDYPEPDRLVQFLNIDPDGSSHFASPTNFLNWKDQTSVFQNVAAYDDAGPGFNLTGAVPELVHGIHVSRNYFALFGAPVMLGRTFNQQEDSPNGGKIVVISYGLWKRKFGGNPNIVGTSISLGDESYTILGVTGKSFVTDPEADSGYPSNSIPTPLTRVTTSWLRGVSSRASHWLRQMLSSRLPRLSSAAAIPTRWPPWTPVGHSALSLCATMWLPARVLPCSCCSERSGWSC